jgi:DNA-binding CsgD family transcriptional regulator
MTGIHRAWLMGAAAAVLSLMVGLLLQTTVYEIGSSIPSLIRQDAHISLPLCRVSPALHGCEPWVGLWTVLEIWERSLQIGQVGGLLAVLVLITGCSVWLTVRIQAESVLPGLLMGSTAALASLLLVLILRIPIATSTPLGITGIVILALLPLGGMAGGRMGQGQLTRQLLHKSVTFHPVVDAQRVARDGEPLSARELEVLALAAQGCNNREIAQKLFLSQATVKTHLQHIYGKLGVNNRTAAVTRALSYGLLRQEDEP